MRTRGIYTTLATTEPPSDMLGSGYPRSVLASGFKQKSSFGPTETPAVVIVGYGPDNQVWSLVDHLQSLEVELVELDTGRSLGTREYHPSFQKVVIQPLAIRLSGNYRVKLMAKGTELDACKFAVTRTNSSGAIERPTTNSIASYAQGMFSVSIQSGGSPEALF